MANKKTTIIDAKSIVPFLHSIDTFLLDCDGVIWRGNTVIPGVVESINLLRSLNKKLIFVTNNSTKSRSQIQKKIQSYGIQCTKEEIFGSAYAAAAYLSSINFKKKAYIIGEKSIGQEFDEFGIKYRGIDEHAYVPKNIDDVATHTDVDPEVGAIVIGLDSGLTYPKLAFAHIQLNDKNCIFIATNTDSILPVNGKTLPGAGTMVAGLSTSTGREPIVLGKPSQTFMKLILESTKIDPKHTCMIGDRLDTDIRFGIDGNLEFTLLVLTGVTTNDWAENPENKILPSHVVPSLGDLHVLWPKSGTNEGDIQKKKSKL